MGLCVDLLNIISGSDDYILPVYAEISDFRYYSGVCEGIESILSMALTVTAASAVFTEKNILLIICVMLFSLSIAIVTMIYRHKKVR